MQEHSLQLKKLICQAPKDAMLKIRRPVYKRLFKSNRVPRADQKKRCKSNLSTVNVLADGSFHQDLIHSGCRGMTVPNVCLQALTLSLLSPRDFFTLSPNREPALRLRFCRLQVISSFIPLHEKFLQFDWLRVVVFQLNLKYLHVKITNLLRVVV